MTKEEDKNKDINKNKTRSKAMSTALVIVISIVVLLLVGVAVVALTSGSLGDLNKKTSDSVGKSMNKLNSYATNPLE